MKLTPNDYRALLRRDLYAFTQRCFYELNPTTTFLPNWHIEVVASALEACRRGEITRLIINQPPRSLKSHCASVAFVAFLLGHDPAAQIICASYGQDFANKHAMDCRTILASAWYQALFPHTRLSSERQAVQEFMTTRQGFRLSTSVGGVLTGRGADFIIIDDPLKPDEALSDTQRKAVNDWFDHTLYSRLNNKRDGRIILVMQRLHEDDLVGHVARHGTVESDSVPRDCRRRRISCDRNTLWNAPFRASCRRSSSSGSESRSRSSIIFAKPRGNTTLPANTSKLRLRWAAEW